MKIKKICEYLCEIGILEIKDINYFLKLYSQIEQNKCKREIDRLKITLFSYINSISKNDNLLFSICRNIIDSYVKAQLVLKYKSLKSLNNIFKNKYTTIFNSFINKLNLHILNKKKNKVLVQTVYYKQNNNLGNNNIYNKSKSKKELIDYKGKIQPKFDINDINNDPKDRITADDVRECTFAPHINEYKPYKTKIQKVKSYRYYSPSFNILAKMPDDAKKNNYLNLNYYTDIERSNTYSAQNTNNRKKCKKSYSSFSKINNYSSRMQNVLNYDNNDYLNNNCLIMVNNDASNMRAKTPRQQSPLLNKKEIINNFLLKQNKHVQDVEKKIFNLKMEGRKKEETECSFSPHIHKYNIQNRYNGYLGNLNNYYRNSNLLSNNNSTNRINYYKNNGICRKFEGALSPVGDTFTRELYNIGQSNSKKRINSVDQDFFNKLSNENVEKEKRVEDLRKKIMKDIYTFSPKIEYNDKYLIKDSFEQRQNKYIDNKKKLEKKKDEEEKEFIDEMNKMYMQKSKGKKDIKRFYNEEEIKKIREKKKTDEKKKKNIIDWNKKHKENKKGKKNFLDIYDIYKKNKASDNKKDKKENNHNDINKDNKNEKKEENKEIQ